jgi:hypothetical protein
LLTLKVGTAAPMHTKSVVTPTRSCVAGECGVGKVAVQIRRRPQPSGAIVTTSTATAEAILREFDAAWRDDTPIFGCCRKAVSTAVEDADLLEVATLGVTERVQTLRASVDADIPGHLESHRCCAGHIADLAFDLPAMVTAGADLSENVPS